jgi:hypothetical protein
MNTAKVKPRVPTLLHARFANKLALLIRAIRDVPQDHKKVIAKTLSLTAETGDVAGRMIEIGFKWLRDTEDDTFLPNPAEPGNCQNCMDSKQECRTLRDPCGNTLTIELDLTCDQCSHLHLLDDESTGATA